MVTSETLQTDGIPVSLVSLTRGGQNGTTWYNVEGFIAQGDICGDLNVYSNTPISAEDAAVRSIFATYRLDPEYESKFEDVLLYAQILYQRQMYKAAAPIFEMALAKLTGPSSVGDLKTTRRVVTDQTGMAYGISGDIPKARSIFQKGLAEDPDYPMYYYNLACADAEEKDLDAARKHLEDAFARKSNLLSGEKMPDPTKDNSFLPYRHNREFWSFLRNLASSD